MGGREEIQKDKTPNRFAFASGAGAKRDGGAMRRTTSNIRSCDSVGSGRRLSCVFMTAETNEDKKHSRRSINQSAVALTR